MPRAVGLRIGRALRHRNYRLFFFGQGMSLIGTWLTRFATSWMAYQLAQRDSLVGAYIVAGQVWMVYSAANAGTILGLVAFFSQAPTRRWRRSPARSSTAGTAIA